MKSIAAVCALPFLLPTPAKRGQKRPKTDPMVILNKLVHLDVQVCIIVYNYIFVRFFLFLLEVKKNVLCSQVDSNELNKIVTMLIDAKKIFIYLLQQ